MKTYYRICVEGEFSKGIYQASDSKVISIIDRSYNPKVSNRPHYSQDKLLKDKITQRGIKDISGYFFCFNSLDALFNWFLPSEVLDFLNNSVNIFRFQVEDEFVLEGSTQCVFLKGKSCDETDISAELLTEAQKRRAIQLNLDTLFK